MPYQNLNTVAFDGKGRIWFTGQNGLCGRLDPTTGEMNVWDAPKGRVPMASPAPRGTISGYFLRPLEAEAPADLAFPGSDQGLVGLLALPPPLCVSRMMAAAPPPAMMMGVTSHVGSEGEAAGLSNPAAALSVIVAQRSPAQGGSLGITQWRFVTWTSQPPANLMNAEPPAGIDTCAPGGSSMGTERASKPLPRSTSTSPLVLVTVAEAAGRTPVVQRLNATHSALSFGINTFSAIGGSNAAISLSTTGDAPSKAEGLSA